MNNTFKNWNKVYIEKVLEEGLDSHDSFSKLEGLSRQDGKVLCYKILMDSFFGDYLKESQEERVLLLETLASLQSEHFNLPHNVIDLIEDYCKYEKN